MSTLKDTNFQHASASDPAIVLAADGSATADTPWPRLPGLLKCADGVHRLRLHPRAVVHQPNDEHPGH
jgi:hypothetical protein